MAWGGWLFASAILIVRSRRRVPSIVLFAVVLACTIYAGHPETLIVMVVATLLLVILVLISRALPARFALPRGPVLRPVIDLLVAGIAGAALGAPLLLPGLQLTGGSIRSASSSANLLPLHDTFFLLFSSFDGEPLSGNYAFGGSYFYDETAAYIGVIALVLASMGLMIGILGRRPEVLALAVVGAAMAAIVYVGPAAHLVSHLPLLNEVDWLRALMPLSLVLAALAGVGVDAITKVRQTPDRQILADRRFRHRGALPRRAVARRAGRRPPELRTQRGRSRQGRELRRAGCRCRAGLDRQRHRPLAVPLENGWRRGSPDWRGGTAGECREYVHLLEL